MKAVSTNYADFCLSGWIACLLVAAFTGCSQPDPGALRVMSYNIRYDNPDDGVNRWDNRKERIVNLVKFYEPHVIGTQEGLLHQLEYLDKALPDYSWVGVGRRDGKSEGEFTAIFYHTGRLELVADSDSTLWLSDTPGVPGSKNWDAALPRIVTRAGFTDKDGGRPFYVFNTHYDHIGDTARARSSEILLEFIRETAGDSPVILTGDFNATEESEPYRILAAEDSGLHDSYYKSELGHLGPEFTFEGFGVMDGGNRGRIDYIFVNGRVNVLKHAILSTFRDGRYPSDHLPVIVDIKF